MRPSGVIYSCLLSQTASETNQPLYEQQKGTHKSKVILQLLAAIFLASWSLLFDLFGSRFWSVLFGKTKLCVGKLFL